MNTKSVAFVTLGCAKNEVDTYDMASKLERAGYSVVSNPSDAFVVIVNTCAFIQSACEESISAILEASELDHIARGEGVLVLAGCLSSRYGLELETELPEVHSFVPCKKEDDIVIVVNDAVRDVAQSKGLLEEDSEGCSQCCVTPLSDVNPYTAYIKISDGCDKRCSYCMIPFIRGSYHSFSYEQIRFDVCQAVQAGAREIILIGQDTGIWGYDLPQPRTFAWLLEMLAEEFSSTWFRVMYVQPLGVTDELLHILAAKSNVCSYLDVPLQHCEKHILKSMNRPGSKDELLSMVERIKKAVPNIALRTTLMVGFPGETEEDFDSLVDFVEQAEFDYVGLFAFSPEEGSAAFDLPQIDEDIKQSRLTEIRDVAESVSSHVISERVGLEVDVLIEGVSEDGQLFGRSMWQAPEVDGETFVDAGAVGEIVSVLLDGSLFYEMEGVIQEAMLKDDARG